MLFNEYLILYVTKINLQLIIQIFIPLRAVIEDVMIVNKELLASGNVFGGDGAGDVSVHGVGQVGELAVGAEAVVHLVAHCGDVRVGCLELLGDVHVSPT